MSLELTINLRLDQLLELGNLIFEKLNRILSGGLLGLRESVARAQTGGSFRSGR